MEQPPECHGVERAFMPAVCRRRSWIYFDRGNNDVLIIKNRHPDARKASARSHQRASRAEGPCVFFRWSTGIHKTANRIFLKNLGCRKNLHVETRHAASHSRIHVRLREHYHGWSSPPSVTGWSGHLCRRYAVEEVGFILIEATMMS